MKRNITDLHVHIKKKGSSGEDKSCEGEIIESKSVIVDDKSVIVDDKSAIIDDKSVILPSKHILCQKPSEIINEETFVSVAQDSHDVIVIEKVVGTVKKPELKMSFSMDMLCKTEKMMVEELEVNSIIIC